jgi:glycosyltransferase involved in cell wall biosynthesis
VIVAYNEERHIGRCLASVNWAAEAIVVDSRSQDRSPEVAERMGARVFTRQWAGYSAQKSFGIAQATQPWILNIDADEEVTPALRAEILRLLAKPDIPEAGFRIRVPLYFLGRQLGHYGREATDPGRLRLFRNGKACFDGAIVHEQVMVDGPVSSLQEIIFHDSYASPVLRIYWRKIHHYATLEARQRLVGDQQRGGPWLRALGRLAWMLLARKGLLHGPRAWIWIVGQAYQEWLTTAKTRRPRRRGTPGRIAPAANTGDRDAV